jgi:pilus assembly protein CpaE
MPRWHRSDGSAPRTGSPRAPADPGASRRWRRTDGQAAAELVALLPLAALLVAGAWQLAVAGHASWAANAAARAAARAAAVGNDARAAANRELPAGLERGARVHDRGDGRVDVTVRIPRVLGLPLLGHTSATAHFRPQR